MASLRFCKVNTAIRIITTAKHGCFGTSLRRQKHLLNGNVLVNETYPKSRKLLAGLQNLHRCGVFYRLEHASASATDIKANSSSSAPPPDSSVASTKAEETKINNSVESSSTQAPPEVTSINDNQQITEAVGSINESSLPPIPAIEELTLMVGEENFKSLGLGGWSLVGLVQEALQFLHYKCDLPWWGSIFLLTLTLKILLIPFSIKMKRLMNEFNNKMPEYQRLKTKADEAKMGGNYYEAAVALQECNNYALENNIFSSKKFLYMLINLPVFCSVFIALNRMARTPGLTSLQTGGLFWFTDLTLQDQYYILPIMLTLTTFALLRLSVTDGSPTFVKCMKYTFPVVIFLVTLRFPTAILIFNVTSNSLSLCQNLLFSWEPVRKYLKIPALIPYQPSTVKKQKSDGIMNDIRRSIRDYKALQEISDRERLNATKFEDSSFAPLKRTFKYNPTQAQAILQSKQKKAN